MGLRRGWSLDLTTRTPDGEAWDFRKASMRKMARELAEKTQPLMVIGSPMCTPYSAIQNLNKGRRDPKTVARELVEAELHMRFCFEVYMDQVR